jgi:patatin-like phospholipase/acyl hydrolase
METVLLHRLISVFPDLLQRVDVMVGVSGGAMVASGLACGNAHYSNITNVHRLIMWFHSLGHSPAFVREMLQTFAPHFFKPKTRNTLQGLALRQAKFPSDPLEVFGREVFRGMSIKDCPKKVIITSFLLDNGLDVEDRSWEPRIYHNIPLKPDQTISSEEEMTMPLWDAVLGSAAAPTFYPSYKKHVDGAVMVNNPCLAALSLCTNEQVWC